MNRKLIAISAGLGLCVLSPVLAYAGCSQLGLAGTWYTYSISVDSSGSFAPQTNRCKVKINTSGSIVASKSSCKVRSWPGLINVNITGGNINVSSSCSLSGLVKINGPEGIEKTKLEFGTVSKDGRTFSSVAYDVSEPNYITHLTGVKR